MLVLGVLYLIDCCIWVDRGDLLVTARFCSRWRVAYSGRLISNGEGGFNMLNPFPPFGQVFLGHFFSYSLSPEGVCSERRLTPDGSTRAVVSDRVWRYDEIERVEVDGKRLLLNGVLFARCGSAARARRLRDQLEALIPLDVAGRERQLKMEMASAFDVSAIRKRVDEVLAGSEGLQSFILFFFLTVFLAFPLLGSWLGLSLVVIPAGVLLFLGGIIIGVRCFRAHRSLYPDRFGERLGILVKCILCPPSAMRARDFLTRYALHPFHPVAIMSVLGSKQQERIAGELVRDGAFPIPYDRGCSDLNRIVSWWWDLEREAMSRAIDDWEASPGVGAFTDLPDWDGDSSHYCPRCQCQLTPVAPTCPDCSGVSLREFGAMSSSSACS